MKEALVKLTGYGLQSDVRNILDDTNGIIFDTHSDKDKGYAVTVAYKK